MDPLVLKELLKNPEVLISGLIVLAAVSFTVPLLIYHFIWFLVLFDARRRELLGASLIVLFFVLCGVGCVALLAYTWRGLLLIPTLALTGFYLYCMYHLLAGIRDRLGRP